MGCAASKTPAMLQLQKENREIQKELEEANKKVKGTLDKAENAKNDVMEA